MPTPKAGTQGEQDEPVIYDNELQLLSKETRDKLQTLTKTADTINKAREEETQIRDGLNHMILESEKVHRPLAQILVTLEDLYQLLAELDLELMDIRSKGNIVTHEKRVKVADTETISQDKIESLINKLENCRDHTKRD